MHLIFMIMQRIAGEAEIAAPASAFGHLLLPQFGLVSAEMNCGFEVCLDFSLE